MKKGQIIEGTVREISFPNVGLVETEEGPVNVKNVLPGQTISCRITKKGHGRAKGQLLSVEKRSSEEMESPCSHFDQVTGCGGCLYQTLPYEKQLAIKEDQVKKLLFDGENDVSRSMEDVVYDGISPSPEQFGFRNKMEFSFGDEFKDGPLALGMHKRGSFYDVITTDHCQIVDEDYRLILRTVLDFAAENHMTYFHRSRLKGFFRHLLVRKAKGTGEILVGIVTSSEGPGISAKENTTAVAGLSAGQDEANGPSLTANGKKTADQLMEELTEKLAQLPAECHTESRAENTQHDEKKQDGRTAENGYEKWHVENKLTGRIVGIVHIINDSIADIVRADEMRILFGKDYFYEKMLGLSFKVTPFSFFQTNTKGAEVLYQIVRDYCVTCVDQKGSGQSDLGSDSAKPRTETTLPDKKPTIFDLYSGTGTIAQVLAPIAEKVVGVEIVEEAVVAARENAALNGLDNCEFLAGDVLKVIDSIQDKPDLIVVDPPRDGIHPKALPKILDFGVDHIIYISCKPSSLARDLEIIEQAGYRMEKYAMVDLYPGTIHVETVVLLNRTLAR
ncbi:MAG: class I SAM-dependent RNA methyltransferase [Lachnospiraceae bacterium]|nr:class I SAM-dependent RNA methyltransferase [Lachnospiraceae bacterium]